MQMPNKIKELRVARAWSQEHLAELAGISARTVQRIENGEQASLETLGALAAVLEVRIVDLTEQTTQAGGAAVDERITDARDRVAAESKFYWRVLRGLVICLFLYFLNRATSPDSHWSWWVAAIWGVLLAVRGLQIFVLRDRIARWQQIRLQKLLRK
ncbi:helix-turn-helix domain-containing protein [Pseudomonas oryzihabitans]|uniref:helix-turn-helix domain-containing protein n=1 Tax=Pseudomonas oryzihabitans TaxID=47885 RepID=UPI0011219AC6|nr:helix-turn-helix domain-containing protein [Pseudomonas psychrotolerans]QDD89308.1 DNA-binding protein [Pseudomonas psychrotolerans]